MAETITLELIMPKWRILALRGAIYALAAGYHLHLISLSRIEGMIDPLSAWVVKGMRVR